MPTSQPFGIYDLLAITFLMGVWFIHSVSVNHGVAGRKSLSILMMRERLAWMERLAHREMRMIDTSIIAGLQNGTAFFASSSLIAIGGCFALFGAIDKFGPIFSTLSVMGSFLPVQMEIKTLGLALFFAFAFFKFSWAYRLFNYCSILIGSVPFVEHIDSDEARKQVAKAATFNILAGQHFNSGQRSMFFAIGYMGWFIGPVWLICTTSLIAVVLIRRQFFSRARAALL